MAYYKESQKKYKEKIKQYKVQYNLQDVDGLRLESYLINTKQSANAYLKALIKADLDSKGFYLPNTDNIPDSTP